MFAAAIQRTRPAHARCDTPADETVSQTRHRPAAQHHDQTRLPVIALWADGVSAVAKNGNIRISFTLDGLFGPGGKAVAGSAKRRLTSTTRGGSQWSETGDVAQPAATGLPGSLLLSVEWFVLGIASGRRSIGIGKARKLISRIRLAEPWRAYCEGVCLQPNFSPLQL